MELSGGVHCLRDGTVAAPAPEGGAPLAHVVAAVFQEGAAGAGGPAGGGGGRGFRRGGAGAGVVSRRPFRATAPPGWGRGPRREEGVVKGVVMAGGGGPRLR